MSESPDGVSLEINAGEFVSAVGTSGSGKSTLLHMMGGLDSPTSGRVLINGEDISEKSAEQLTVFRRRHIGFVFRNKEKPLPFARRRLKILRSAISWGRCEKFMQYSGLLWKIAPRF